MGDKRIGSASDPDQNSEEPLAIDLYAGAGGMSLGFESAGFRVVGAVDSDPIHVATYRSNFPNTPAVQEDIRLVSGDHLRRWFLNNGQVVDVMFGGPPCQGFSYIGRNWPGDPRNELLLHFARIATELLPRFFVVENVEGLLAKRHEQTLQDFVNTVKQAGYRLNPEPWVLDAQEFGVPQRRRRVFLVGVLKGGKTLGRPKDSTERPTVWDAISDLTVVDETPELLDGDVYFGALGKSSKYAAGLRHDHDRPYARGVPTEMTLTGCRSSAHTASTRERFARTREGEYESVSRFFRLARNAVGPTLRAGTNRENGSYTAARPIHPTKNRCITVREAARLHSFPDSFQFNPTIWHGFRQIGNSVPPMLAKAVGASILELC